MIKKIPGFEGYYIDHNSKIYTKDFLVRKQSLNKDGYLYITISQNGVNRHLTAHRAVALAFVPNPNPEILTDVNHKNGIRTDNRPINLEWCTRQYNVVHGFKTNGRTVKGRPGSSNALSKLTEVQVKDIKNLLGAGTPYITIQTDYGVSYSTVYRIANNLGWQHVK